jgi:DNA-binding beta-propeller fold protein YncE
MRIIYSFVLVTLLLTAVLTAACSVGGGNPAIVVSVSDPAADLAPKLVAKIGKPGQGKGTLNRPFGVAVDARGQVYVTDLLGIQVFNSGGGFVRTLVPTGEGLRLPTGLAISPAGDVFVADSAAHDVKRFDAAGGLIATIGQPGRPGDLSPGPGQFNNPTDLAFDPQGNLYVVDQGNSRVQKFDAQDNFAQVIGGRGEANGQFTRPRGVAIDASGNLYVTDLSTFLIQKFDAQGNFVQVIGGRGEANGQFTRPRGVAIDASGNLYVTDLSTFLIQKFDAQGRYLARIGQSHGEEHFWLMRGVATDSQGRVYTVDGLNHRVQVFDPQGRLVLEFGQSGTADGQFSDPEDLTLDAQGNLYLVDKGNHRVQKFRLSK